ncbi:MAG: ATP-binding protein [Candidatus Electrothrix sp. Rat3]|nr:ATP-binding protein [Candidatus Electrothrix rattekaaiensis]
MIRGGIGGKLGDRYEAKWLVRIAMEVLAGKADWLHFEGVESAFRGFEFAIGRKEITEWHQTKINSPQGNWTINALKKEGILKAFADRLAADEHARCFFVSQDNAKDFRTLTEKAQLANSCEEYQDILKKKKELFRQLQAEWNSSDELSFDWLKRSQVEMIPERELDSFTESYGDLYFHQGGKSAFPNLRDLLERHFNKKLTTEGLRKAVKEQGILQFKEWAFDPSIPQRLQEETEAYLGTYTPFGMDGETIPRTQADQILDELRKSDSPELILLTGVAGSGKSGVIRSVIQHLREAEVPYLAFRVDQHLDCATREELGERLTGRKESPVSTLKGTFPEETSVLIIDQVDAVSDVSGRDGQVKEVLFRLIRDADIFGGIKIIAACRTFDFDSDARIKELQQKELTKKIEVPLLDWKSEVEPLLRNKKIDTSRFSQPQRDLLCLPVNLAVFLEIDEPELAFHSCANLHEELIKKKQRQLPKGLQWSLVQPLSSICEWMSKRQKLSASVVVLDDFPGAADILSHEGLIVSSRGQVNFFHESFFDHIYARSFLKNEQSMVEWLTTTEQHLFRRTQVRQILEALRRNDDQRYVEELASLLHSERIRFHMKAAICQWLGSIDEPTEEEWQIISRLDDQDGAFPLLFRHAVFSIHAARVDLLNRKKWIEQQLAHDNQERVESIFSWLSFIAEKRPAEIAAILRSWWGDNPQRAERLLGWFRFAHWRKPAEFCGPLLDLCEEIIRSHPAVLFQQQDDHFLFSILNDWANELPELGGRILQVVFNAWFAAYPGKLPFGDKEFKIIEGHDSHALAEFVEKAPVEFLAVATEFLVHCVNIVVTEGRNSRGWWDFKHRTTSEHHYKSDGFLSIYRKALKKVAQQQPVEAEKYLQQLDPYKHECLMHLHLEAIQANPKELGNRLPSLARNRLVFNAGYDGADWLSFAHACKAAFPFLESKERLQIEKDISNYFPEIKYDLSRSRYEQWCIFENIEESLLSLETTALLEQLQRKFRNEKIEEPNNFKMQKIKAPISTDQCARMKDSHWLSAIKKYCISNNKIEEYRIHELARNLEAEASKNPVRFARLCFHIPKEANSLYIEYVILGLAKAEELPDDLIVQVIIFVHYHHLRYFGSSIATLIKKHPALAANSEILDILIWYALNGTVIKDNTAEEERIKNETYSIEHIIGKRSLSYQCDLTGERGAAWEALSVVLHEFPQTEDRIWEALEEAFEKEPLVSVRCTIIRVLGQLYNINKDRFTVAIKKLIVLPVTTSCNADHMRLSPLISHTGINLFPYMFHWLPDVAKELTAALLKSEDETKELIGAWLIFGQSFRNDEYIEQAEQLATRSVNHRRLLADVVADVLTWTENRRRAEQLLKEFFFDEDKQVREQATHVFRKIRGEEIERCRELAEQFVQSPAISERSFSFLHMLQDASCDVLDLVIGAAERLITVIEEEGDYDRRIERDVHYLNDLLKREYASSEKNAEVRKRLLDVIDRMLSHNIYGVDSIVSAHDRW